jgi:hypothetical protein
MRDEALIPASVEMLYSEPTITKKGWYDHVTGEDMEVCEVEHLWYCICLNNLCGTNQCLQIVATNGCIMHECTNCAFIRVTVL